MTCIKKVDKISNIAIKTKSIASLLSVYLLEKDRDSVLFDELLAEVVWQIEDNLEEIKQLAEELY